MGRMQIVGIQEVRSGNGIDIAQGDQVNVNDEYSGRIENAVQYSEANQPDGYLALDGNGNLNANFILRGDTLANWDGVIPEENELIVVDGEDGKYLALGDGTSPGDELSQIVGGGGDVGSGIDSGSTVYVKADGTPTENWTALLAAYAAAKALTPGGAAKSATNRVTVLAGPGTYEYDGANVLVLDTQFVDPVSEAGPLSTLIKLNAAAIQHTCPNVTLRGFTINSTGSNGSLQFNTTDMSGIVHEDLIYTGSAAAGTVFTTANVGATNGLEGTYRRIRSTVPGTYGRGSFANGVRATFEDCVGVGQSFGGGTTAPGNAFYGTWRRVRNIGNGSTNVNQNIVLQAGAVVEDCYLKNGAGNVDCLRTGDTDSAAPHAVIRNCVLIPSGTGYSVNASTTGRYAAVVRCDMATNGINATNVTNVVSSDTFNSNNAAALA